MYRPVHPWRCYTCTKLLNPTTAPSPATSCPTFCAFSASSLPSLSVQQQHAGAGWQDSEGSRSRLSERYLLRRQERALSSVLLPSPILALPRRIEDVTCLECLALGASPPSWPSPTPPQGSKSASSSRPPARPCACCASARLSNRHPPSSPRIHTRNPFKRWRPEKKPIIVTVSTSVSHAHHLTPPNAATHPPRPPRGEAKRPFWRPPPPVAITSTLAASVWQSSNESD